MPWFMPICFSPATSRWPLAAPRSRHADGAGEVLLLADGARAAELVVR